MHLDHQERAAETVRAGARETLVPLENKDHQVPQVRLASRVLKAPQAPEALRAEQDPPEQEDSRDPEDHGVA